MVRFVPKSDISDAIGSTANPWLQVITSAWADMASPFRHVSASGDSTLRHHRAAEGLLEGGYEFVLRLDGDIKPVVLLGEALGLAEALLACPGETLHANR